MNRTSTLCKVLLAAALTLGAASCAKDEPVEITIPAGDVTFVWNSTEPQTVPVEANYDWDFKLTDEHGICKVEKTGDGKGLLITPNVNYATKAYTATIEVSAGKGDNLGQKTITVSQGANSKTYMNFLDSKLEEENPVFIVGGDASGKPAVTEIRFVTNNVVSVKLSDNQEVQVPGEETDPGEETKSSSFDGYDWLKYDLATEETPEGVVNVLKITTDYNESLTDKNMIAVEIVSGSKDIENDILTKRIGFVVMPDTPAIFINPVTSQNNPYIVDYSGKTENITIVSNVDYTVYPDAQGWDVAPSVKLVKDEGRTKTYELTCPPSYLTQERTAGIIADYGTSSKGDYIATRFYIKQGAAPKASVKLENGHLTLDAKTKSALVKVESSLPVFTTCDCSATWLKAAYDAETATVKIDVEDAVENSREATVTVNVGKAGNSASAVLNVTQLGTKPAIIVTPSEIQLNEKGDAVTVNVVTNQDSWTVDASASSDFTLATDTKANTITVSGTPVTGGKRQAVYTLTAGTATATLTVSQSKAYKVGDPYMAVINGKDVPVGIVYEVDAEGMHGKAFSLTVKNGADRFYFYDEQYYKEHRYDSEHGWDELPVEISPRSESDGWYNRTEFMKWANWNNEWNMITWVEDLAKAQGVSWYIPAIDELKALISYMSGGVGFISGEDPHGLYTTIDALDESKANEIKAGWQKTRDVYRQYTHPEGSSYSDYYTEEQYVVFEEADVRTASEWGDYGYYPAGDDLASYVWGSSTAYKYQGTDNIKTVNFRSNYYVGDDEFYRQLVSRVGACADAANGPFFDEGFTASIHPICKF